MKVERLADVASLEACVGARPPTFHLKSIPFLDEHCITFLERCPFAVVAVANDRGELSSLTVGGKPGVLVARDTTLLAVDGLAELDVADGAPVGILAFVPGYRETLRVNGSLRSGRDDGWATISVDEAFLHCAKAIIRSDLWATPPTENPPRLSRGPISLADADVAAFFDASPFITLASCDAHNNADVSPKGDPPGLVAKILDDRTVAIGDRPGNRRTDTMHNIVERDSVSMLAIVPGSNQVVEVRGSAVVTDDEQIRSRLAVRDRIPDVAIVITADTVEACDAPEISEAELWNPERHVEPGDLPKATQIWTDHVKQNDDPGIAASTARRTINERLLSAGIDADYRENLYGPPTVEESTVRITAISRGPKVTARCVLGIAVAVTGVVAVWRLARRRHR